MWGNSFKMALPVPSWTIKSPWPCMLPIAQGHPAASLSIRGASQPFGSFQACCNFLGRQSNSPCRAHWLGLRGALHPISMPQHCSAADEAGDCSAISSCYLIQESSCISTRNKDKVGTQSSHCSWVRLNEGERHTPLKKPNLDVS